jgi:hypothetical protein
VQKLSSKLSNSIKCSRADSRVKVWKLPDVSGPDSVPHFGVLLMVWQNQNWKLSVLLCVVYTPVQLGHELECNPFCLVGAVKMSLHLAKALIAGCVERLSILIVGCHVGLNLKPASLLEVPGCGCISTASFTIRVMYVAVLFSLCVFF